VSDALDYLLKVRPDAMGHYFRFLKEAGSHLDPKTRALISVITKVHAQTEAGFRQYLRRALRDGAQPAEVIDALLMAFPALGLTKIVWAIDLLLEMDLPEFRAEALAGEARWHRVGALSDFRPDETVRRVVDERTLLVHRGEEVRVYDARCPHQSTLLDETGFDGSRVICARHGWEFDLRDGRCLYGNAPLREYAHDVVDGDLMARW
jgi:nitrite reductase/ring-hydroxylating ferredoxin subunit/alkylhydroperoxidase/carboxymuconolactone decarboxylase family protein YurZ